MKIIVVVPSLFLMLFGPSFSQSCLSTELGVSESVLYYPSGSGCRDFHLSPWAFIAIGTSNAAVIYERKKLGRLASKPLLSEKELRMIKRKRLQFGLAALLGTASGAVALLAARDACDKDEWYILAAAHVPIVAVSIESIRKCGKILAQNKSRK